MKEETYLTGKLAKAIKVVMPSSKYLKLSDSQSGVPDFIVAWRKMTSWHEVKVADPEFDCPGIQELTCCILAQQSHCDIIIYDLQEDDVRIIPPNALANWRDSGVVFSGLNHAAVAAYIAELHLSQRPINQ